MQSIVGDPDERRAAMADAWENTREPPRIPVPTLANLS
jgi:hypothetical protein